MISTVKIDMKWGKIDKMIKMKERKKINKYRIENRKQKKRKRKKDKIKRKMKERKKKNKKRNTTDLLFQLDLKSWKFRKENSFSNNKDFLLTVKFLSFSNFLKFQMIWNFENNFQQDLKFVN